MSSEEERQATKENIASPDPPHYEEEGPKKLPKSQQEIEKEQEAKLRSKYPQLKGPGNSAFLQKRLSKGQKYFDSGDYNMAKAKMGPPGAKGPLPGKVPVLVPPGSTGDAIPTPESVPVRKTSIAHLKHLT